MGHERRRRRTPRGVPAEEAPSALDEAPLRRATEVNEALAWEFDRPSGRPLANPAIRRMEALGVEACALATVGLERARWVRLHVAEGLGLDAGGRPSDGPFDVALAVAWADGALTVLRAQALSRRGATSEGR
jgi:hypothetical protein